jgi:hypothetical protein
LVNQIQSDLAGKDFTVKAIALDLAREVYRAPSSFGESAVIRGFGHRHFSSDGTGIFVMGRRAGCDEPTAEQPISLPKWNRKPRPIAGTGILGFRIKIGYSQCAMSFLPLNELPGLLPDVETWVRGLEIQAVTFGEPVSLSAHPYARAAGVHHPEKICIRYVSKIPRPKHPRIEELAQSIGLLTNGTGGITAGYGILIRNDCREDLKLLIHEFVHVAQYERLGIPEFIRQYIQQLAESGYISAAFEEEAKIKSESILRSEQ